MSSDFIESVVVKILIALGTTWATKNGVTVDGGTWQVIGGALVALGSAGYGLYQAYGQRKVPAAAVAVIPAAPGAAVGTTVTGKVVA